MEHYEIDGWASLSFGWWYLTSQCDPAGDGIVLYELPDYQGRCLSFFGDYRDLNLVGFNDIASSVELRGSYADQYEVALYEQTYYHGDSLVLTSNQSDLSTSGFDEIASSLRIRPLVDGHEPDDACMQASELGTDSSLQHHTFHTGNGSDWTTFYATSGFTYTIRTLNLGPYADTTLTLYRSDCTTQIAYNDDSEGLASQIEWLADTTGPVYIEVASWGGYTGPGRFYDLQLTVSPP